MLDPADSSGSESEAILERFLDEIEHASDPEAVVSAYCDRYPSMADEFWLIWFTLDLERCSDSTALVERFVRLRPHLADEFRKRAADREGLERMGAAQDEPVPRRLGDFVLGRRIAYGGMGEVYAATQEPLGRKVAVKVIRPGRIGPDARNRFLREQKALAMLHQTHIVPIYAAGEHGSTQYFAMPFIAGAALHEIIRGLARSQASDTGTSTPTLRELASRSARRHAHLVTTKDRVSGAAPTADAPSATVTQPSLPALLPSEPKTPAPPRRLSRAYFESVALAMIDIAEGLHHAHEANLVHRDLKPSNIMVDETGHCWIIDFGLAAALDGKGSEQPGAPAGPFEVLALGGDGATAHGGDLATSFRTAAGKVMGSPPYMSPEHFQGCAKRAADIWGLGVVLYEMLALRRPYSGTTMDEIRPQVLETPPPYPSKFVRNVPADLERICLKALRRNQDERYPSAQAFADDLRRWLRGEPTVGCKTNPLRRLWLWSRRNKGWAAAVVAMVVAVAMFTTYLAASTAAAEKRRLVADRNALLQNLQQLRLTERYAGWHDNAWSLARTAARIHVEDSPDAAASLRDQAAAVLVGLDARESKGFAFPGSAVAFDATGDRLLIGGMGAADGAKLWCRRTDELFRSQLGGAGPVAFTKNGTPLQLVAQDPCSFLLWDVSQQRALHTLVLPKPSKQLDSSAPTILALHESKAAATALAPENVPIIVVWDVDAGKLVHRFSFPATALAFAPDAAILVAGDEQGRISVWSLSDGSHVATLQSDHSAISSLAVATSPVSSGQPDWLIACGKNGGEIVVWSVRQRIPISYLRGSQFNVHTLAFSEDGTMLASAGRMNARVWDVFGGRLLLQLLDGEYASGICFASDSHQLALCTTGDFAPPRVKVYDVVDGHGIRSLRGLNTQVMYLARSADERLTAALTHDWRIGTWDSATGQLRRVFQRPPGFTVDNAAVAFSTDGSRLVSSAWTDAIEWDLNTGTQRKAVRLPPGLLDLILETPAGKVLLVRLETEDGKAPLSDAHPAKHPRIWRVRSFDDAAVVAEIRDCNWHGFARVATHDGSIVAVEGVANRDGKRHNVISAYRTDTWERIWIHSQPMETPHQFTLALDASGQMLAYRITETGPAVVVDPATKRLLGHVDNNYNAIGAAANMWVSPAEPNSSGKRVGYALFRQSRVEPLVNLGIDLPAEHVVPRFSRNGREFLWGTSDGTVRVCDLVAVNRKLSELGLGW